MQLPPANVHSDSGNSENSFQMPLSLSPHPTTRSFPLSVLFPPGLDARTAAGRTHVFRHRYPPLLAAQGPVPGKGLPQWPAGGSTLSALRAASAGPPNALPTAPLKFGTPAPRTPDEVPGPQPRVPLPSAAGSLPLHRTPSTASAALSLRGDTLLNPFSRPPAGVPQPAVPLKPLVPFG